MSLIDDPTRMIAEADARAKVRSSMTREREVRNLPFRAVELREKPDGTGGTALTFTGFACVTEVGYDMQDWAGPYTEIVRKGAFTKTLAEGADVTFLVNHTGLTLARTKPGTLSLTEIVDGDTTGLFTEARLDPVSPDVIALRSAVERKDVDEMSFAFWCIRQQWSPDWMQRDILEVSIDKGDVSAVNFGANPNTAGATMRHRLPAGLTVRVLRTVLGELRAGKVLSAQNESILAHVLELASDADDAVDEIQVVLSDLLGVPNPDDPDDVPDPVTETETETEGHQGAPDVAIAQARARVLALRSRL